MLCFMIKLEFVDQIYQLLNWCNYWPQSVCYVMPDLRFKHYSFMFSIF